MLNLVSDVVSVQDRIIASSLPKQTPVYFLVVSIVISLNHAQFWQRHMHRIGVTYTQVQCVRTL